MFRPRYHPSSGVTQLYTFRYGNGYHCMMHGTTKLKFTDYIV